MRFKLGKALLTGATVSCVSYFLNSYTVASSETQAHQDDIFISVPTRDQQLQKLKSNTIYDLLIVGGGSTGTGAALVCIYYICLP